MAEMRITEDQMTYLLKEFLKQYDGNFDHVSFDAVEGQNGFLINFHKVADYIPKYKEEEPSQTNDFLNPLSPISIFNGFGGFGGGSSGGGGASGQW